MNCSEAKFVMSLYLSSELDAPAMADFELHVQTCRACARDLEYTRHCDELLRLACREQTFDTLGLRQRVLKEISKSRLRRRFFFARSAYSLPIAAGLLLAMAIAIGFFILRGGASQTVYAAARDDHYVEVVQHDPRPWVETPAGIRDFVTQELGTADFLDRLTPVGYQLKRALPCYLLDRTYVHLVYQKDAREVSIFIRRKDIELPGATVETVDGCALHATSIKNYEIAAFQSQKYTVLVVSDLPRTESLSIARNAIQSFT
jgi:anti-sigma factor RsiW